MVMDCRAVERMCARPVCCCILHYVYCILILILIHWALYRNRIPLLILPFWPSSGRKTLKIFACGAFASGGDCGGPSNTPFSPSSGGLVTDLRITPGRDCWLLGKGMDAGEGRAEVW